MRIGFLITARLKSQRLKNKILLEVGGKPILDIIIERCKQVQGIDGIVLCTSNLESDSILENNAKNADIGFFKGSGNDVLDRLLNAAIKYNFDAFLSITADNPLFSIYISEILVKLYKSEKTDFLFTKGLPIGTFPYLLDVNALKVAVMMKKEIDTEIWGPFVNRPDFFKIGNLIATNSTYDQNFRITCDFIEDYNLIKNIFELLPNEPYPDLEHVYCLFKNRKELLSINNMHIQRSVAKELMIKIDKYFELNKQKGLEYARQNNISFNPGLINFYLYLFESEIRSMEVITD